MFTSFKTNVNNNLEKNIDNIFSNSVEDILNKDKRRDNSLTFSNINGITLKEIDELFEDKEKKNYEEVRFLLVKTNRKGKEKRFFFFSFFFNFMLDLSLFSKFKKKK